MLDDLGLVPALLWHLRRYTAQTGVRVAFHHAGLGRRFSPEGETAAYRIVQEALTNVARHAGVGEAAVRISLDRDALRLQIEDRGAGFDAAAAAIRRLRPVGDAAARGPAGRTAGRGVGARSGTRLTAEWPEEAGEGEARWG